jgi:hexokinase
MNKRGSHLKEICRAFELSRGDLKKIVLNFHNEMKKGLAGEKSSLKMLPAFIDRATGKEKGCYLALDFGGTNFRILQVELRGKRKVKVRRAGKFVIPNSVMHGTGTRLFNFIAKSIKKFLIKNKIDPTEKLGFTFSFPIRQKNIVSGVLINWTKGFTADGVVGNDVVKLLNSALEKNGMRNIKIAALANDTVGTLAAGSYARKDCDAGVIFGTGTNACYVEKTAAIKKLKRDAKTPPHMIVNLEWGNFRGLPLNEYDVKLDKSTVNPGRQTMEKMISGMYLGELARIVIGDLIFKRLPKWGLKTPDLSFIETDQTNELIKIRFLLRQKGIKDTTLEQRKLVKKICRMVSKRAAKIGAAAISAVVTKTDPALKKRHSVAVDGTLYEKYPGFKESILATLKELYGKKSKNIRLFDAAGGSGAGAAVAAAIASSDFSRNFDTAPFRPISQ